MKTKLFKIIPLLVCAALMLTACGVSTSTAGATETAAAADTASAATSKTGSTVSVSAVNASELVSDAFSNRDLAGTYDEDGEIVTLTGSGAETSSANVTVSGSTVTITAAGTYILSGSLENGSVVVNATKDDKIQLVLNGVSINSDTSAAIYVKQADKVFITLAEGSENSLSNGGSFRQTDDNNVDGVIFSKDDLTLNGSGSLTIVSPAGHGVVCKDELVIAGGTYSITASGHGIQAKDSLAVADGSISIKAGKDGVHVENDDDLTLGSICLSDGSIDITAADDGVHANTFILIDGGSLTVSAAEGIEATYIQINGGTVAITASDDGINAANRSSAYTPTVEINGGSITIDMGAGDTDGVDSNGNIVITGGTISVTGSSTFDYDGTATYTGGTIIVNGQQIDYIPNQMMGGGFGGSTGNGGFTGNGGPNGGRGFH